MLSIPFYALERKRGQDGILFCEIIYLGSNNNSVINVNDNSILLDNNNNINKS